jgi:dolichol-phosphate mannosyltransferase
MAEGPASYQVTLIMTALNEEQNLARALDDALSAFARLNIQGEVLLINDGSTDGTAAVAERYLAQHPNIRMITHETPHGVGGSFWEGVWKARSEIVVWVPGDGENDCYDVLRYLPLMEHVDMVVPFVYNREVRSPERQLLSKAYKAIINLTFGMLLNYMNGTVMYRRAILRDLELSNPGFFYQTELLIKTIRRGYLYAEVPQGLRLREGGVSKAVSLRSFRAVARGYLQTLLAFYFSDSPRGEIAQDSVTWERRQKLRE